jgi:hypothetical protein
VLYSFTLKLKTLFAHFQLILRIAEEQLGVDVARKTGQ